MKYSLEITYKVWNDDTGESIEIGPDSDSLDLIEIRTRSKEGKIEARIVFGAEAIPALIEALTLMKKSTPTVDSKGTEPVSQPKEDSHG